MFFSLGPSRGNLIDIISFVFHLSVSQGHDGLEIANLNAFIFNSRTVVTNLNWEVFNKLQIWGTSRSNKGKVWVARKRSLHVHREAFSNMVEHARKGFSGKGWKSSHSTKPKREKEKGFRGKALKQSRQ